MKAKKVAQNFLLHQRAQNMPVRRLGKTNLMVKAFGLGGQALLETPDRQKDAYDLINKALDLGVNYFDTASIYGPSREYLGKSLGNRRKNIVLNSKVYKRGYTEAKRELSETFDLLKTNYIDIVQLHAMKTLDDLKVLGKGGSLQAILEAQRAGKIRFIGVTGHYDPDVLSRFLDEFPFDTLLTVTNPVAPRFDALIEKARAMDIGIIGMKIMSRGVLPKKYPAEQLLFYALKRCDVGIVGCSNQTDLENNVSVAADYCLCLVPQFPDMPAKLREEASFFLKEFDGKVKWPTTYQPNWPDLQYDK